MKLLLFTSLVVLHVLQDVSAVPVPNNKDLLQQLTSVGVQAIRNDLGEGVHKLDEVHDLMSSDERVRLIAMQSANQTHQIALQNLITEWRTFKMTNNTCADNLQYTYIHQCIPCIIDNCEGYYESHCRTVTPSLATRHDQVLIKGAQLAPPARQREFITGVREFFQNAIDAVSVVDVVGEWFNSRYGDLPFILDDLEWTWGQIKQTAEDIRQFRKYDTHGWVVDITDDFIEFFTKELENWLKRERNEIVSSVTDQVDGWYDEQIDDDYNVLENVRKSFGSFWDSLTDWVTGNDGIRGDTESDKKNGTAVDWVQGEAREFYDEHLSEYAQLINQTYNNAKGLYDEDVDTAAIHSRVTGWFDNTFGTVFEVVANKTRDQVDRVFDDVSDIFGAPFHDRRRRSTSHSISVETSLDDGLRQVTCNALNDDKTRGQTCMTFSSECSECSLLPETDCPGFVHAKDALVRSLLDFRNATAIYKTVFEAFKEGQEEYYYGLQNLAKRYRWIANFQRLPKDMRGYRILELKSLPEDIDQPDHVLSPVEVTVVMFGKPPHTFTVDIPTNPLNNDIAGTMIAAKALAWYATYGL